MSTIANVSLGVTVNKASLTQAERDIQAAISRIEKLSASGALIGKGYTQPLGRITGAANEFEKSLEAANARVVAFGASAGAILLVQRALEGLVRSTIEVEKSLTEINTLLNLSSSGLSKFGDQLFAVASGTGQAFEVASKAALEFSRQGLGLEETLKRTRDALILSRLSGLDVVASTTALTDAMNSFNESVIDSTELVNKLANVDAAFAVSSADLAEAIKRVGSTAQDAGVGIDELIALVTSAQQVTARGGSVIGNSLKTIFTRAQRPEVLNDLHNFGVAVKDSSGAALPAIQILKNFANAYDGLSSSQKSSSTELLGGVYQINILKAAIGDLGKEFSIYDSALRTSSSATNEASVRNEVLNKTLSALLIQTTNNLTKVGAAAGKLTIEPALRNVLGFVNDSLDELSEKNPEDVGSKIGKGILEGIGRVISGPGLILFGALFGKLAVNFISFSGNALKTFAGLNEGARHQAELQQLIQNLLLKNPQLINAATSSAQGQLAVEKEILRVVRDRNSALQKSSDLSEKMAANIALQSPRPSRGRAAGGLIPNFAASDENSEIISAIAGGYNPGQVKQMSLPGVGRVTYNTAETVKQFPGMSQPAIMPPQQSEAGERYGKSFQKAHGFDPYAAGGFVPNFINSRDYDVTDGDSTKNKGEIKGRTKKKIEGRLSRVDAVEKQHRYGSEATSLAERILYKNFQSSTELAASSNNKSAAHNRYLFESDELSGSLIERGWAVPDLRYGGSAYDSETMRAMSRGVGIWNSKNKGDGYFLHPKAQQYVQQKNLDKKLSPDIGGRNSLLKPKPEIGMYNGKLLPAKSYKSGKKVELEDRQFADGFIPNFEKTIDPSKLTRWDKIKYFNPGFSVFRQPYLKPDGTGVGRKEISKDPIAWGNAYEMFLKNGGLQSIGFSDPKHILGGTPIDFLARYKTGDPYALDAKIGHDDAKSSSVQRKLDTMIPFIRGQSFQGRLFKTEFLEHGFKEEELDRLKTGIVFGNASDKETGSKQIARAATAGVSVGGKSQFANMSSGFVPNFDRAFARKGEAVMPGPAAFTKIYKDQLAKKISFLDFDGTLIHTKGDVEYAKASTSEAKSKVLQDFFTNPGRINDIESAKLTRFGSDLKARIDANKILPNLLGIMTASDKTAGMPEYINRTWKIPMANQRYGDKTGTKAAEMAKLRATGKAGEGPAVGRLVDDLAVARGFVPNLADVRKIEHYKSGELGEENRIVAGKGSSLRYIEDEERFSIDYHSSKNKGDGFAQFQELATLSHKSGKPIYSNSLSAQRNRLGLAQKRSTNFGALRAFYPQLDYRMIGGFVTEGDYAHEIRDLAGGPPEKLSLKFKSLADVQKKVDVRNIERDEYNNALGFDDVYLSGLTTKRIKEGPGDASLRNASKGFVPNFNSEPSIHSPELFSRQPGSRSTTHKLPFLGKSFGRLMGLVNRFNENPLFTGTVRYQKGVGLVGSLSHFKDFLEREDPGLRRTVGLAEGFVPNFAGEEPSKLGLTAKTLGIEALKALLTNIFGVDDIVTPIEALRLKELTIEDAKLALKIFASQKTRGDRRRELFFKIRDSSPASGGFVPNFNALKDSIDREKAAGYSSGQIRVGKDSSLVTSWNPDGAAVFNSTEGSLKRALSMHRSSGKSPEDLRSQGASKGFVPNLAVDKIDAAIMMASLMALSTVFKQLSDSGFILTKTQKLANEARLKELNIQKRALSATNTANVQANRVARANLADSAVSVLGGPVAEKSRAAAAKAKADLQQSKADLAANRTAARDLARSTNNSVSQLSSRATANAPQLGMTAAFTAPMISSMATQFMPSATEGQAQGKAAVEGLGDVVSMAGTGASIGAIFGPLGAGIGAAIGGLVGLTMAIGKVDEAATNFKIEQVTFKLEQIDAKNQQVAQSFQSYIDGAEKLSNAFENPEKTRPQDLIRIKDQMAKSMQGIPDEFKNKFDSSLGSVEKMRLVFAEITEDLGRQKADLVAAKSTFEMVKETTGFLDREVFEQKDVKRFKPIAETNVSSAANRSGIQERIKNKTLPKDSDYKDLTPDNIEKRFQGLFGESFLGALSTIKDEKGLKVFGQIMKKFIDSAVESAAAVEKSSIILKRLAEENKLWSKQLEYAKSRIIELNTTLAALGESAKNRVFTLKEIASMERKSRADILTTNQKGAIDLGKTFMSEESIAIANSNLKIQELQIQKLEKIDDTIRKSQEDVFGILTKTEREASEKYLQSIDKAAGTNTPADEAQKGIEIYGQLRKDTNMRMQSLLQETARGDFDKNRALEELLADQRTAAEKGGSSEELIVAMEASIRGAFQALDHSLTDSLAKFETATNAQILIEKEQLKYQILLIQQQKRLQSFGGAGNFSQAGQSGFSSNLDEIQSLYGDRFRALSSGSSVDIGRSSTKYLETLQSDFGIKNLEKQFPPLVREAFRGRSADIFRQGQEIEKFSEIREVKIPEGNKMTKEKADRLAAEQMSSRLKLESLPDEVQRIRNNSDHLNDLIQYQGEDLVGKNTKAFKDAIEMSGLKGAVDYISTTEQNVGGLLLGGAMGNTNKLLGPLNEIAQKQFELNQAITAQQNLQKKIDIEKQIREISEGKSDSELNEESQKLFNESQGADIVDIENFNGARLNPDHLQEYNTLLAQELFQTLRNGLNPRDYDSAGILRSLALNKTLSDEMLKIEKKLHAQVKESQQIGPRTEKQRNAETLFKKLEARKAEIKKLKEQLPKPTTIIGSDFAAPPGTVGQPQIYVKLAGDSESNYKPLPDGTKTSPYSDEQMKNAIKGTSQFALNTKAFPREDPIREPLEKINRLAKVEALKLTTKEIQAKIDKNEEEQNKLDLSIYKDQKKSPIHPSPTELESSALALSIYKDQKAILEAQKRGYQVILDQKIETEKRKKIYDDLIDEENQTRESAKLAVNNGEEMNRLQKRLGEIAVEKAKHTAEQLRVTATEAQNNRTLFSPEKSQKYHDADIASIRAGEYEKVDMKRAIGGRLEYTKIDRQEAIYKSADRFAEQFPDKISGALTEALSGAKTFRQAFSDIFADMGKELLGDALKIGIRSIISGLKNSFNSGGIVRGYSLGGQVSGGSGTRDDIPAMLSSGEYVVRKAAVNKYGSDFLEKLNKGSLVKRAEGGSADISEQLKYTYNDENRPSEGEFETGGLSLLAIQDQNNPQVKIMEAKEAALRNYLVEKVAFDKAQKDAIKAFKKGQRRQAIMALVQAAISVAGNSIKLPPKGTQLAATSASMATSESMAAKSPELYGGEGRGYVPYQPSRYFNQPLTLGGRGFASGGPSGVDDIPALFTGGEYVPYQPSRYFNQPLTLGGRGFASGGPSGVDDIPALLTGGEYVMRKDSVEHYGEDFFNRLNRGSIKGYADGGLVGGGRGETVGDTFNKSSVSGGLTNNITISVNITNEGSVSDSKKDQSGTANQEQQDQGKLLSEKVEAKIVEILLQEKRPGGILYNPNTKDN